MTPSLLLAAALSLSGPSWAAKPAAAPSYGKEVPADEWLEVVVEKVPRRVCAPCFNEAGDKAKLKTFVFAKIDTYKGIAVYQAGQPLDLEVMVHDGGHRMLKAGKGMADAAAPKSSPTPTIIVIDPAKPGDWQKRIKPSLDKTAELFE